MIRTEIPELPSETANEIERRNGTQPPFEIGHDMDLHPPNHTRIEHEPRFKQLEIEQQKDIRFLHFRRKRQARDGQKLERPLIFSLQRKLKQETQRRQDPIWSLNASTDVSSRVIVPKEDKWRENGQDSSQKGMPLRGEIGNADAPAQMQNRSIIARNGSEISSNLGEICL